MANFKLITTLEAFASLRSGWDRLVASHPQPRIFQRYDWIYHAWTSYHMVMHPEDELKIIVATRDAHEEVAILPFFVRKGVLRLIGDELSDVCDVIYPKHDGSWHTFWKDVVKYIERLPFVRDVWFEKLEGDGEFLSFLAVYFEREPATLERCTTYSYFKTKPSEDLKIIFPQLDSKERSNLRSLNKRFLEYKFKILSKKNGDDYPELGLKKLLARMIDAGIRDAHSGLEACIEFMRMFYDEGWCELAVFEKDGQFDLASYRLLEGSGYITFWIVFYSDSQMTTAADVKYVLAKIPEGEHIFDYGTGAYSYKLGTFRPNITHLYRFVSRSANFGNFLREVKKVLREFVKVPVKRLCGQLRNKE